MRERILGRVAVSRQELAWPVPVARHSSGGVVVGRRSWSVRARLARKPVAMKRAATRAKKRQEQADKLRRDDDEPPPPAAPTDLPEHQVRHETDGTPKPKAQRNFTDPDSRIMKSNGAYIQGYNAHTVVDSERQIIIASGVGNRGAGVASLRRSRRERVLYITDAASRPDSAFVQVRCHRRRCLHQPVCRRVAEGTPRTWPLHQGRFRRR